MSEAVPTTNQVKATELVASLQTSHPDTLGKINKNRAVTLTQSLFSELKTQIATAAPGRINVRGLGLFVITEKTITKDDGTEEVRRRVVFRVKK